MSNEITTDVIYPRAHLPIERSLAMFTFPYSDISEDTEFSFCLTSQSAIPTYGYVVIQFTESTITSYCLLSQFFYPRDYFELLHKYIANKSIRALEAQQERPVDWNGESHHRVVKECITSGLSIFNICDIGRILIAMLVDSHIVVIGSKIARVERFCYSLLAFIDPLAWPGVFIPVLPETLTETLYAPFPYIIGIHTSMISAMESTEMEAHVLVDVDRRTFTFVGIDWKIPRAVQKMIDALPESVCELGIDAAYRKLMMGAVESVCGGKLKQPETLVAHYKKKLEGKKAHEKSFNGAILQSRLVQSLMQEVECAPQGEVFVAFAEEERTFELKPTPPPKAPEILEIEEVKKPVIEEVKKPPDALQQIMQMAERFSSKNWNIEARIRENRVRERPLSCDMSKNPEVLPFRDRMRFFERRLHLDDRGGMAKTSTALQEGCKE